MVADRGADRGRVDRAGETGGSPPGARRARRAELVYAGRPHGLGWVRLGAPTRDVLDSLRHLPSPTVSDLCEDTGRGRVSVNHVLWGAMYHGLVAVVEPVLSLPRRWRLTPAGEAAAADPDAWSRPLRDRQVRRLGPRARVVLTRVADCPGESAQAIATAVGRGHQAVLDALALLRQRGLVGSDPVTEARADGGRVLWHATEAGYERLGRGW